MWQRAWKRKLRGFLKAASPTLGPSEALLLPLEQEMPLVPTSTAAIRFNRIHQPYYIYTYMYQPSPHKSRSSQASVSTNHAKIPTC